MSLESVIKQYAPLLGAAASAINPAAGLVVSLVGQAFGAEKTDDILAKINADPQASVKLKELELQHEEALKQVTSKNYIASLKDKSDARALADKAGSNYRLFLRHFAYMITFGFFLTLAALFVPNVNINSSEKQIIMMLIGVLVSKWSTVVDFFYGSSNPPQ